MNTDADFLERNRAAGKKRRRVRLCFVALMACVVMMADLVVDADAKSLADDWRLTAPAADIAQAKDRASCAEANAHL